eukprot:935297-Prymnesium_polylepis.1
MPRVSEQRWPTAIFGTMDGVGKVALAALAHYNPRQGQAEGLGLRVRVRLRRTVDLLAAHGDAGRVCVDDEAREGGACVFGRVGLGEHKEPAVLGGDTCHIRVGLWRAQ